MNEHSRTEHMLTLMEAALPSLPPDAQSSIRLILKTQDLMKSAKETQHELSATELNSHQTPVNLEQLLENLFPVCNTKEQALVRNLQNFIRAGKLYRSYQNFQSASPAANPNSSLNPSFSDFLLSQLTPEQKETMQQMQALFQTTS